MKRVQQRRRVHPRLPFQVRHPPRFKDVLPDLRRDEGERVQGLRAGLNVRGAMAGFPSKARARRPLPQSRGNEMPDLVAPAWDERRRLRIHGALPLEPGCLSGFAKAVAIG